MTNWMGNTPARVAALAKSSATQKKDAQKKDEQKGMARLRLKDVSVGALAEAFSTPSRPLKKMKLAGSSSGAVRSDGRSLFPILKVKWQSM